MTNNDEKNLTGSGTDIAEKCQSCGGKDAPQHSGRPGQRSLVAQEPHSCPYASEIHDDNETLCNCCEACEHECRQDI